MDSGAEGLSKIDSTHDYLIPKISRILHILYNQVNYDVFHLDRLSTYMFHLVIIKLILYSIVYITNA